MNGIAGNLNADLAGQSSQLNNKNDSQQGINQKPSHQSERKRKRLEPISVCDVKYAEVESSVHDPSPSESFQNSFRVNRQDEFSTFSDHFPVQHTKIGGIAKTQSNLNSDDSSSDESLKINHIELKSYAWIGSMFEHCSARTVTELLHIYQGFLLHSIKMPRMAIDGRGRSKLQDAQVVKLLFSEQLKFHREVYNSLAVEAAHASLGEDHLLIRLVALIRQLQCLNHRLLQLFVPDSPKSWWSSEHEALHRWFLEDILKPLGIRSNFTFSMTETESRTQSVNYLAKIQAQVSEYLHQNQSDETILRIFSNKRNKQHTLRLGKLLSQKTKLTVSMIGIYYKTTNLRKWNALFPLDEDFVKMMAFLKYRNFQEKAFFFFSPEKSRVLGSLNMIPWKNPWSDEELQIFHSALIFHRVYFYRPEGLISIALPESFDLNMEPPP